MRKTVLTMSLLTIGLLATDFSSLTTQELIDMRGTVAVEDRGDFRAEMQSRMATMSEEELTSFRASRQSQDVGGGQGQAKQTPPTLADFDKDGDGKISEVELTEARSARQAENAEDGKLLKNAGNAPEFAELDSNGDGYIDSTELQSHQTAQMESHQNSMGHQGQGMGQGKGRGQGGGMGQNK